MKHVFALIAFALFAASCATPPAAPTYALTVLDVRGADLYARIEDSGLSQSDCVAARAAYPRAVCEVEK